MPNSFEYMKHQVAQQERIRAETAHEHHIIEFRAMCAKMIDEAIPVITARVKEECMRELRQQAKQAEQHKQQEVEIVVNTEKVKRSIFEAIKRAFR